MPKRRTRSRMGRLTGIRPACPFSGGAWTFFSSSIPSIPSSPRKRLLYILYGYLKDRKQDLKNSGKVWLIILAGYEVICIGILLVAGNKFGFLPTFPFAGTLTMGVGMLLLFVGSIYGYQSNLKE